MKLYMVPLAPNPTKVMLYIAEREHLGTEMNIEQVVVNTVKGRHKEPEHLARNPFGKVPVLELEDGSYLTESLPIIHYLEDKFPDGCLLGTNAEERAKALNLERIVELQLAIPMGRYGHAVNSPLGYPKDEKLAERLLGEMQMPLDYLENGLADKGPFLFGSDVSIADLTLQSALQFIRYVEAEIFGERPMLRQWDASYRERPAPQSVLRW